MGCTWSVESKAARLRRRLSLEQLGGVSATALAEPRDCREQDRLLLGGFGSRPLLSFVAQDGRKYSISSETDQALNMSHSFASKCTRVVGDVSTSEDISRDGIGFSCRKGLKPEAPNQDSFLILRVQGVFSLYGVFDGHGRKGHDVSNFVKDNLPKLLLSSTDFLTDPMSSLRHAFGTMQRLVEEATLTQRIDAQRSGCTASLLLHHHTNNILYIAHVGDSRCVLGQQTLGATSEARLWQATDLTEDHKPNHPAERARIESNGGQVRFDGAFNYRVYARGQRYPGLNMSRALGDLLGFHDAGISAVPDIAERALEHQAPSVPQERVVRLRPDEPTPASASPPVKAAGALERRPGQLRTSSSITSVPSYVPSLSSRSIDPASDKFILLCSDGVWEFVSSEEAVQLVAQFPAHRAMDAAEQLATEAWSRWMYHMQGEVVDDITAIVVHLEVPTGDDMTHMTSP